jgi:glycosyltransferase involved in cell wall biosynthesis
MQPAILIGLPCYGRPAFLKEALDHLARQTFRNFRVLLHENPSEASDIEGIAAAFKRDGLPIDYHRHQRNIGILANFTSVVEPAETPYFMWAADDDLRHPESLTILIGMLEAAPQRHLAASSVEVINTDGRTIDHHPGFSRFTTGADRGAALVDFLAEPEIAGKANVIYGVFRTPALKTALAALGGGLPEGWGPDLAFLAAFLSRFDMVGTDRVLFRKRTNNARTKPLAKRYPGDYGWPTQEFIGLKARILAGLPDDAMRRNVSAMLDARQRHLAGLGGLRRGALKALGLDAAAAHAPDARDRWHRLPDDDRAIMDDAAGAQPSGGRS